ncbi:ATP-dependent DNA helicase [Pseudarthrobacter chlorophenolicus A6]|uniref:ATP-dependent DNA helicase n=1 Tax=Pseudarthrobacter chlorophenolicus (strain ATCC 700700 / DSM 12829 / CIP 107037 / JCM 12360 / KCTC 9906 / NCIMB 13794 / A6) TaxID=452863 RepID=B8HGD6_PSECP|nr:AAA family ATPase [Pseudarthrobacter chlorophenolicus]ACL39498.1 ATP-dependent DNA helicase [Pseudarthrobacter chlorophenolicus A6]SDQ98390.1 DNA helicase IV [Pseudarthrobacter chlorophenolicus]
MLDADLAHEREYVAGLYARLEELREEKRRQLAQVRRSGAVGTMQNVSERDAFAALYEDRLAQLDAVDDRLVFGRLDLDSGEEQYIGRIGLTTEDLQRLMVDWRAPEAGHFYQATAFDRQGVRRRRHLILQGRDVKAIEDDVLDASMLSEDESLQGEGALLAALNSKRTGRMSDIVSTIQSEQDRIIRSSISGALVVQGGPGTGKTAVALHRAAYLLYTHRDRLKSAGVLLVGPSSSFMKYIERVLPSLGETGVVMASVGRLMPGIHAVPEADPDVAAIKGRLDMAKIVANAVSNRQRTPAANRILEVDGRKLTLTPRQVRRARERARSTGKPHNEARVTFVKILLRELTEQLTDMIEADNIGNNADRSYLAEDVRTARDVRIALNLCWMPMTPEKLISELFSKPAILEFCTPHLSPAERELLRRPVDAPWTEADVPLLDEAAELLGELDPAAGRGLAQQEHDRARDLANAKQTLENMQMAGVDPLMSAEELAEQNREQEARQTAAERATSDRTWAFGHIVVDEAQELSPMQWRLLVRRCPLKSFTIVGDIAQTSSVAGANSWQGALAPMFGERWQLEELTVNYRTPSQIAEAAVRMANAAGLVVSAPKAVREGRWSPIVDEVEAGAVVSRLVEVLPEELEALDGGLLAVIADGELLPAATSALRAAYGRRIGTGAGSYEQDIVVISPREAKGLEFDGVVVLEPSTMLNHEHGKVGDLYVAMTRATQRLRLIAAQPVPAGIVR